MPRDANGNMTLPPGNPVVTGTAISSATFNATIADLAAEIQDSLSRSGEGGMLTVFKNSDGTAQNPSITFDSDATTGWWRTALGWLAASVLGVERVAITNAGMAVNGEVEIGGNLFNNESFAIESTGAGHRLDLKTNGSVRFSVSDTDIGAWALPITNVADPSAPQDAATKNYVDTHGGSSAAVGMVGTGNWSTAGSAVYSSGKTIAGAVSASAGAGCTWSSIATLNSHPQILMTNVVGTVYESVAGAYIPAIFSIQDSGVVSCEKYLTQADGQWTTITTLRANPVATDAVHFNFTFIIA